MRAPDKLQIEIPDFALVVLIGASGSGKSTFAAKHFLPTEIISSDHCRGLVSDDETDQSASADAFDLVRTIAEKRLKRRKLAVIDATNVRAADRKGWVEVARRWHALPVAVVIEPGIDICIERNKSRSDRQFGGQVIQRMVAEIRKGLRGLQREGFRQTWQLSTPESVEAATVTRQPLWTDKRADTGPFDIIGDVHGCADELENLLRELGYDVAWNEARQVTVTPPPGRKAVFVGDLGDRGPRTPDVLRIAMHMEESGTAYVIQGNHDRKLFRWLDGRNVTISHGLQQSIDQLVGEDDGFRAKAKTFLDGLRSHAWLDGGKLAVAHAGLKEEMIGRGSGAVREFALFGETTGEMDEFGLPVRRDWAAEYRGDTSVIYGHVATSEVQWVNNTLCIDTGCVYGGKLTALRWPEKQIVSVPAAQVYYEPTRPLVSVDDARSAQAESDDILDMADVSGRRWIDTELRGRIVVAEENAAAALEVMSRFALAPQWLAYLPPTMSPSETSKQEGWLERPEEAFEHFRKNGVAEVVCEEKHMGSRAIVRSAATQQPRARVSTSPARKPAQSGLEPGAHSFPMPRPPKPCWPGCERRWTASAPGRNLRPIGCFSMLKSCLGRPRPVLLSTANTRQWLFPRGRDLPRRTMRSPVRPGAASRSTRLGRVSWIVRNGRRRTLMPGHPMFGLYPAWKICALRRFTCWLAKAGFGSIATMSGTWRLAIGSPTLLKRS
jgi:protein phosphatase